MVIQIETYCAATAIIPAPCMHLQATGMVQQRVLAHEGITAAARDFLATKLQTSNVPVRG